MAIGEAGTLSANTTVANAPISVSFSSPLTDPVIALTGTQVGGHPYTLRVLSVETDTNGEATGFTFTIEEWEYLDGAHPAVETINWLAVEEGVHTLPDGRVIEAGFASADHTNTAVSLTGGFGTPPVVLTSVMSNNDTTTVDSDPLNVTATGFDVRLQEEEAEDGLHAAETVGWIAVQPGAGAVTDTTVTHVPEAINLGGTFTDPITLAETQTINGGNPETVQIASINGSDEATVFLQEEQSDDSETNHINETVGLVTFEQGQILCFTPGTLIDTPFGPRDVATLEVGDLVLTADQGPQPIRYVARRRLSPADLHLAPHLRPVTIRAGALAPGLPTRDLTVSPQHRMLLTGWRAQLHFGLEEVLVPARGLVNDNSILVDHRPAPVDYIHLCLDQHQILTAHGAQTESLLPGALEKSDLPPAAREELFTLFPHLRSASGMGDPAARPILPMRAAGALR